MWQSPTGHGDDGIFFPSSSLVTLLNPYLTAIFSHSVFTREWSGKLYNHFTAYIQNQNPSLVSTNVGELKRKLNSTELKSDSQWRAGWRFMF